MARDYRKGRIYLPLEDLERFSYTEEALSREIDREIDPGTTGGTTGGISGAKVSDNFRRLLAFEVERAMSRFVAGAALAPTLEGPARLDVALFTRGGVAVLDAIKKRGYDVLTARPTLSRSRKGALFLSTWLRWKLGRSMGLPGPS